jgi:hypothetical protein
VAAAAAVAAVVEAAALQVPVSSVVEVAAALRVSGAALGL